MRKSAGFTLLELMLSMAIFTVVSLAGFTIFDTVFKSEKGGREKIASLNKLQTAFILLERDLSQIARRHVRKEGSDTSNDFIYSNKGGFSSNIEGLSFVRHGWTNPALMLPRSDLQAVGYRLEDQRLERTYYNYVDPVLGEEPKVRVLLDGVTDVLFEFYYDNKWQKELITGKMPVGVAVEVTTEEFGNMRRQFLVTGDVSTTKKASGN